MANPPLYGTEYVAHALTFTRGDSSDVTHVGICANTNPNFTPEPDNVVGSMAGDFNVVSLIVPPDPLAEGTKIDVLALIGPKGGADFELPDGDYQLWVLVATANEDIVRKTGTLTVL
jgi:hypothetical protein